MKFDISAEEIRLNCLKMHFTNQPILYIPQQIQCEIARFRDRIFPGMRLAVAVGSRGISNYAHIVGEAVRQLQLLGAAPFIVPAMGSHGGATAEGQRDVLASYGITEETMHVPIYSSMETVIMGQLPEDTSVNVYMDRFAYEADGVFVINRVKAHTDFHGEHESGLVKMLAIGLGKHMQALSIHARLTRGLREYIPAITREIIASGKILGGLAIVEDGYEQTSILKGVFSEELVQEDHRLLELAKEMMPKLPFLHAHVLVVDQSGKNISGTGMDPNVIGRIGIRGQENGFPHIDRICVLDITDQSHGNAAGIGLADIITERMQKKINWRDTYENILTTRALERGFMPIVQPTDRQAIEAAICGVEKLPVSALKLARIKDTLHIDTLFVTDALLAQLSGDVDLLERGIPLEFDHYGTIKSPW